MKSLFPHTNPLFITLDTRVANEVFRYTPYDHNLVVETPVDK